MQTVARPGVMGGGGGPDFLIFSLRPILKFFQIRSETVGGGATGYEAIVPRAYIKSLPVLTRSAKDIIYVHLHC